MKISTSVHLKNCIKIFWILQIMHLIIMKNVREKTKVLKGAWKFYFPPCKGIMTDRRRRTNQHNVQRTEVGIYKRKTRTRPRKRQGKKKENTLSTKKASKKKRKKLSFFLNHFLGRVLVFCLFVFFFLLSCFLL